MKSFLILCLLVVCAAFTISTVIGCVCACIDIIRSKDRYHVSASVDEVPADYLSSSSDLEVDSELSDKKVIS